MGSREGSDSRRMVRCAQRPGQPPAVPAVPPRPRPGRKPTCVSGPTWHLAAAKTDPGENPLAGARQPQNLENNGFKLLERQLTVSRPSEKDLAF